MAEQINSKDPMSNFVDNLITEAGLTGIPDDFLEIYKANLMAQVQRRIGIIAIGELNDEKKAEYVTRFIEENDVDPMEMQKYLVENVSDFENKLQIGLQELASEFISAAKQS
ncbi:MAG: hypothetical protein Q8P90_02360 [bacterium]|nr:hypothetical protein [bacterium]